MVFRPARRYGRIWEDAQTLHDTIRRFDFQTTGKKEKDFERALAQVLMNSKRDYHSDVITQVGRHSPVQSVYCFGKKHRPDMTIGEDGIAVEMKFVRYAGLQDAIGQGHLYRLRYRFVFLILVLSEERKEVYESIDNGEEKDLEDALWHLADQMNIFTYIAPSYLIHTPGTRNVVPFFRE